MSKGPIMPTTIQTTVYAFDELSDPAKEIARAWHRETGLDHAWHEFVYADFEAVCAILGVSLRTSPVRLMGGGSRPEPHIFFRGFWSQGDGACFEGTYADERRAPTAVLVGHRPPGDTLDALLRCCRVLVVEKGEKESADSDIRDRLSVLLPLSEAGPVSQLANPDDELRQRTEVLGDQAKLTPLIEAAHRGPKAVEAALAALLQQPLTTLGEVDQP